MYNNQKIIVVLPAYNAVATLKATVQDLPDLVDEIILVDDKSNDETVTLARHLGLTVFEHAQNSGYGANQKTCYRLALEHGADIIVMLHPDYQYDPKLVKYFAAFIGDNYFDVMLGTRIRSRREALAGGMPLYKYFSNRALTMFENLVSGYNLSEWHTGMRAYRRAVLEKINWSKNSNISSLIPKSYFRWWPLVIGSEKSQLLSAILLKHLLLVFPVVYNMELVQLLSVYATYLIKALFDISYGKKVLATSFFPNRLVKYLATFFIDFHFWLPSLWSDFVF